MAFQGFVAHRLQVALLQQFFWEFLEKCTDLGQVLE
jgi:hypothetical protein